MNQNKFLKSLKYGIFKHMHTTKSILGKYHALFEPTEKGGFDVSFPDFIGCYTFGRTFEEAKKKAKEVLELWIEVMVEEGKKIPKPNRQLFLIDEIQTRLPKKHLYATSYRKTVKTHT